MMSVVAGHTCSQDKARGQELGREEKETQMKTKTAVAGRRERQQDGREVRRRTEREEVGRPTARPDDSSTPQHEFQEYMQEKQRENPTHHTTYHTTRSDRQNI